MKKMFTRYLVTGATGYLGKVIVKKLLQAGRTVRALVLEGDPAAGELPAGVQLCRGGVDDASSLRDLFAGDLSSSCLIHCAGIISIATRRDPRLQRVNVEGTKNILDACRRHGVERVVYVSSVHAIPERPKGQIIRETADFSPGLVKGQYAKSKAAATAYALSAAARGLDVSIVHPSGIIGPYDTGRGNITSTILSFCGRRLPAAVKGGYDFVDVRDVADGIIACCEKGRPGEGYILSGRYAQLKEIFRILSDAGYGREPRYLPLRFVKLMAPLFELGSVLRRRPLFLTPYSAYTLGSNALFSHEKASRELGYAPRELGVTIRDMLCWLTAEGAIPPAKRVPRGRLRRA